MCTIICMYAYILYIRDFKIAASCVIYPLKLKRDLSDTNLKFPMNKNMNDSRCSVTHKDHGLWVPGTHKEVNDF